MALGPMEFIIVLPIALLGGILGFVRLLRLIRQLRRTGQRRTSFEPESHLRRPITNYQLRARPSSARFSTRK